MILESSVSSHREPFGRPCRSQSSSVMRLPEKRTDIGEGGDSTCLALSNEAAWSPNRRGDEDRAADTDGIRFCDAITFGTQSCHEKESEWMGEWWMHCM
jgi:hypothetical protein